MKTAQQVDWRGTHIGSTPLGLSSDPFVTDAAISDFAQRKAMHKVLDKACSKGNVTADRAQQLHARLDSLLDEQPEFFSMLTNDQEPEEEEEEEPEEVDEEQNLREHEVPASRISAKDSRSIAMDSAPLLDPDANAQVALADLCKKVDINRPEIKPWYQIMWNCAGKMNPVSKIKDMPKTVVDFCMDRIAEGVTP